MPQTYQEAVEQIKSRLDIVEVVQRYMVLKKSGTNYMGCCPFHKEKTPSFSVNRTKGIFKCFGCGEGGDALSFLMKIQGKNFKEIIEEEAKALGIELPITKFDGDYRNKKQSIQEAVKKATKYFHENLLFSSEGECARNYLKKRNISAEVIEEYCIGYSQKSYDDLQRKINTDNEILEKAGLVIKREKGKGYIDRFRNRIMIPIRDESGNVVAFGARALEEGQNPKYLNSPDTILYNKSRILYGFDKAKSSIREQDSVIICEGYFDAISLQSGGIKNAVASCGTALTPEHIMLIAKYSESRRIYLSFDTDKAGQIATERSANLIKEVFSGLGDIKQFDSCYMTSGNKYSCEIRVISPPEGKDPDEYIREKGSQAYMEHIKKAPLLLDYKLNLLLDEIKEDTSLIEKNKTITKIIFLIEEIENNIVQNEYIKTIATRLQIDEQMLIKEIKAIEKKQDIDNQSLKEINNQIVTKSSNFIEKMQKNLFSLFFTNVSDDNLSELIRTIKTQKIENNNLKILIETIDKITFKSNNAQELAESLFNEYANNNEIKNTIADLIYLSKCYENLTDQDIKIAIAETVDKIERYRRKEEIKKLRQMSGNINDNESAIVQYQITVNEKLKSENWRN